MIRLALGSNIGDRVGYLQTASKFLITERVIEAPIRFSPIYHSPALLPAGAPNTWDSDFLNCVVEGETQLEPQEVLRACKRIEKRLGRAPHEKWAPREIDIDFITDDRHERITGDELKLPHPGICERAFVYLPLKDLGFQVVGRDPREVECWPIDLKPLPTELVGILNITPDSFSDGNYFLKSEKAIERFKAMVHEGASVIDIGAESTRPMALRVSPEEEWKRLEVVLQEVSKLRDQNYSWIKLSLDSRHFSSWEKACELGINWFNDVSAEVCEKKLGLIRESEADLVWMHHMSIPADRNKTIPLDKNPVQFVTDWFKQRLQHLEDLQLDTSRCILDPGIGFGKTPSQSLSLIQNTSKFHELGCRLLVGHSRKSFLQLITNEPPAFRDIHTAYFSAFLAKRGVEYLRVHDIRASRQAIESALLVN